MLIRRALKEDLPALAEIELEHPFYPAWGLKGLQGELSNRNAVILLAENEKKPAGFIDFWIVRPEVQLNAVVVSKAGLRRGAATGLLAKMYEYAKKNACFYIDLEVNAANLPAIKLYEKHGFSVVGRRPKFYNNSEDALLMRKALDSAPGEKND
ncbi:MAG: GNAT family N-acetyltransferase [Elusimicrobia bacterium]|nr:GNAT family N-acetyltransferase [Elusimicrobiota bacterium]